MPTQFICIYFELISLHNSAQRCYHLYLICFVASNESFRKWSLFFALNWSEYKSVITFQVRVLCGKWRAIFVKEKKWTQFSMKWYAFVGVLKTLLANFYCIVSSKVCWRHVFNGKSHKSLLLLKIYIVSFLIIYVYFLIKSKYKRHGFQRAFPIKTPTSSSWNRFKWFKITHHNLNFQLKLSNTHQDANGDIHSLCNVCMHVYNFGLVCFISFPSFYFQVDFSQRLAQKLANTMQI